MLSKAGMNDMNIIIIMPLKCLPNKKHEVIKYWTASIPSTILNQSELWHFLYEKKLLLYH